MLNQAFNRLKLEPQIAQLIIGNKRKNVYSHLPSIIRHQPQTTLLLRDLISLLESNLHLYKLYRGKILELTELIDQVDYRPD